MNEPVQVTYQKEKRSRRRYSRLYKFFVPSSRVVYREKNTSPAWHLQFLSFLMATGFTIKSILLTLNPKMDIFFPYLSTASVLNYLTYLTPAAVGLNVVSTWKSIKEFYYAENKNLDKCLDLVVKIVTTSAAITYLGFVLSGATALVLTVAPYLLIAVAGVGVLYGLFNCAKHLYRAYKADDKEKRKEHLWEAGKQFVNAIANSFAIVVSIFIGVKINAEFAQLTGKFFHDLVIMQNVGEIFKSAIPYVYAFGIVSALAILPSIAKKVWQINKETAESIKKVFTTHPSTTLKEVGKKFTAKWNHLWQFVRDTKYVALPIILVPIAFEVISVTVTTVFRLALLPISLLTAIGSGIKQCFTGKAKTNPVVSADVKPESSSAKHIFTQLKVSDAALPTAMSRAREDFDNPKSKMKQRDSAAFADYRKLTEMINNKIAVLEKYGDKIGKKDAAKLALIRDIREHREVGDLNVLMLDGLVQKAKQISPRVFQSFWCEVGEVEEIVRAVKKHLRGKVDNIQPPPANQAIFSAIERPRTPQLIL